MIVYKIIWPKSVSGRDFAKFVTSNKELAALFWTNYTKKHLVIFKKKIKFGHWNIDRQISMIMNTIEFKSAEEYTVPDIEVIEIELNQNILQASQVQRGLPDFDDGGDAW